MSSDLLIMRDKIREHLTEDIVLDDRKIIKGCENTLTNAAACVEWLQEEYPKKYGKRGGK